MGEEGESIADLFGVSLNVNGQLQSYLIVIAHPLLQFHGLYGASVPLEFRQRVFCPLHITEHV